MRTVSTKTKSIRLSPDEQRSVGVYVQHTGEVEAAVLKRAMMRGLREERLERGLMAYLGGETSSEAARIAGLDRYAFLAAASEKGIAMTREDPRTFLEDVRQASAVLGNERLAAAVRTVERDLEDSHR